MDREQENARKREPVKFCRRGIIILEQSIIVNFSGPFPRYFSVSHGLELHRMEKSVHFLKKRRAAKRRQPLDGLPRVGPFGIFPVSRG